MIKKIGEENPVVKTCGFSLWFIDPYGPVLVRKEEKYLDCPYDVKLGDCDYADGTEPEVEYNLVIAFDWEGCMIEFKLGYKKEKHLDAAFDKINEKDIYATIDGILNPEKRSKRGGVSNVRGTDGDVR